ncbi:hypothetical protein [Tianweitania sediminis]|jgi:hypothetical protein|uniref:Uncharacterized protein n=1 Tax=Tianweitania sediminis TaxID=1502156 RepID=A0A8J7RGW5_9HYPH|nr:hypothetical protein [Tianweitania sediminis]MBP0438206.1 hypothetical protein [Tianweitania sediminis]HEV7415864.1 hypothetical protein [Tianweitania sediminis]
MKTKIFALALAATMAAGTAFAQTSTTTQQTQSGGSNATAQQNERGVPMLPNEMIDSFYTDSTRTTMKSDADLATWWGGLTVQEQEAAKAGCSEEGIAAQQRDLPESTLNVCRKVNAM